MIKTFKLAVLGCLSLTASIFLVPLLLTIKFLSYDFSRIYESDERSDRKE